MPSHPEKSLPKPSPESWQFLYDQLAQKVDTNFFRLADEFCSGMPFFQGCAASYEDAEYLHQLCLSWDPTISHKGESDLERSAEEVFLDWEEKLNNPTAQNPHPSAYFSLGEKPNRFLAVYGVPSMGPLPTFSFFPDNLVLAWNKVIRGELLPHKPGFRFHARVLHPKAHSNQTEQDTPFQDQFSGSRIIFSLEYALSGSKKGPLGRSVGRKNQVWSWDILEISQDKALRLSRDRQATGYMLSFAFLNPGNLEQSPIPPAVLRGIQDMILSHARIGFTVPRHILLQNSRKDTLEVPNPMASFFEYRPTPAFFDFHPQTAQVREDMLQIMGRFLHHHPFNSQDFHQNFVLAALRGMKAAAFRLKRDIGVEKKSPERLQFFEPADVLYLVANQWVGHLSEALEFAQREENPDPDEIEDFYHFWWLHSLELWLRMSGTVSKPSTR